MARLVTVLEAMESMGMKPSLEDQLTPILNSAIDKATVRVESELGYPLKRASSTDLFKPDSEQFCGVVPNDLLALKLNSLFVDPETVVVTYKQLITDPTAVMDPTTIIVDGDAGIIHVPVDYDTQYVEVAYDFGFLGTDDCKEQIKQSLLMLLPAIFSASQVTTEAGESGEKKNSMDLTKGLLALYLKQPGFLYRHIRSVRS